MRIVSMIAGLALIAGFASAQSYTGDLYSVTGTGTLFKTNITTGVVTSLADVGTGSDGIAVAYDNQGILWSEYGNSVSTIASAIYEWRNNTNTALFTTTDYQIEEILVNQNGEVVFSGQDRSQTPNVTGVFKWTGGSNVTTIATTVAFGISRSFLDGGMDVNINTGNYMVGSAFTTPGQVWDIADNGTVTSLVTTPTSPTGGRYSLHQDKRDGTILQSGFSSYRTIDGTGTQTVKTPTGTGTDYYYGFRGDRASVPDMMRKAYSIYHGNSTTSTTNSINVVSDPKGTPTYTQVKLVQTESVSSCLGCVFGDERNIGSMKTGPGAYTLNFNFPGEGGKQYVVGLSASGFFPGFQLPDMRNICLNVDVLTIASINNVLKPFFDPGTGTLDANGNATGSIALGVDNLNQLIHLVAVTVSGGNLDTVSDPVVIKL